MKVEFVKADKSDFTELERLARRLWHDAFDKLIGLEQVDYMLGRFQSRAAFIRQTEEEGYEYYFIAADGKRAGYTAHCVTSDGALFLSKLYLSPEYRGKGLGTAGLNFAAKTAVLRKLKRVFLTVNKRNARAVEVYEKFGFKKIDSVKTDIGEGFFMDDYVYEYRV